MKAQVSKTVTEEIEISIPSYWSDGVCHKWAILSENKYSTICVTSTTDSSHSISVVNNAQPFACGGNNEITRDEFMAAFAKVNQLLISKVSPPTQDELNDAAISAEANFKPERTEIFA